MLNQELQNEINALWNRKDALDGSDIYVIENVMKKLDSGELRIAQKSDGKWYVNEYLKRAILLYFKSHKSQLMPSSDGNFFDKVPLKMSNWKQNDFEQCEFRAVPGAIVRHSAYIAKHVVLMPCFVNVGAYVDEDTMIDSHALVGSCSQIGKRCHISDSVTIGGVLEPIQANPVIVEDDCFIGAKSVVTEGAIIGEGSVISAGTIITGSTKIIDRESGEIFYGNVPSHSVVVPGTYVSKNNLSISCAVIIKKVSLETKKKTSINELLRD